MEESEKLLLTIIVIVGVLVVAIALYFIFRAVIKSKSEAYCEAYCEAFGDTTAHTDSLKQKYAKTDELVNSIFDSNTGDLKIESDYDALSKDIIKTRTNLAAFSGTTWKTNKVYPPKGTTVEDWNLMVTMRDIGREEKGYEKDNALLRSRCRAFKKADHWVISCTYKYRHKKADGEWKRGIANWMLVRKR